jgi:hypothetical protein
MGKIDERREAIRHIREMQPESSKDDVHKAINWLEFENIVASLHIEEAIMQKVEEKANKITRLAYVLAGTTITITVLCMLSNLM